MPSFEIVRVLDETNLIDSESYQRQFHINRDTSLVAGYYIVIWPEYATQLTYENDARFFGPFRSRSDASTMVVRAIDLTPPGRARLKSAPLPWERS